VGTRLDRRFFESTRGRIVTLLRRSGFTVEELARELGLTNNGVRANLATLERDGIVWQRGSVRHESGGGKPAYVYDLTPEAEDHFPKAYEPVLHRLLDVLAEQLGVDESEALLRVVGRLMAKGETPPSRGPRERLEAAVQVLNDLGGLAELEEQDGAYVIRGYSCPLGGVTPEHPEVCRMVEALITELAGGPVYEHCDRGAKPRCCFEVAAPGGSEEKQRGLSAS
jgi:predicted ArsR family transcriptional regulator